MDHRQETDRLRARFTAWLETMVRRARIDYLRKQNIPMDIVSLENLMKEEELVADEDWTAQLLFSQDDFHFKEEKLAAAYAELPLMRRQILKLLFVDELKMDEIAKKLNCSPNYVSKSKQRAIAFLRKRLTEAGDEDG